MPFVQAKCPMCGGMLAVDDAKKASICQFCGDAFVVEEAVNNYNTYNTYNNDNSTTHNYSDGAVVNIYEGQSSASTLLERAFMFLEDADFDRADDYCERVLDIEPENAQAYLGKLLAELEVKSKEDLEDCFTSFEDNPNFLKILRFADDELKTEMEKYNACVQDNIESLYEVECPACGEIFYVDEEVFDVNEVECPACGEVLEIEFEE